MRALLLILTLAGCTKSGGAESLIGATCDTGNDCDVTGVCITDGPEGMCSLACEEPGLPQQCPSGTYCDSGEFTTDSLSSRQMILCLPACEREEDCREGYACRGISGGPGKVCRPR